jgi:hypothetical protein
VPLLLLELLVAPLLLELLVSHPKSPHDRHTFAAGVSPSNGCLARRTSVMPQASPEGQSPCLEQGTAALQKTSHISLGAQSESFEQVASQPLPPPPTLQAESTSTASASARGSHARAPPERARARASPVNLSHTMAPLSCDPRENARRFKAIRPDVHGPCRRLSCAIHVPCWKVRPVEERDANGRVEGGTVTLSRGVTGRETTRSIVRGGALARSPEGWDA